MCSSSRPRSHSPAWLPALRRSAFRAAGRGEGDVAQMRLSAPSAWCGATSLLTRQERRGTCPSIWSFDDRPERRVLAGPRECGVHPRRPLWGQGGVCGGRVSLGLQCGSVGEPLLAGPGSSSPACPRRPCVLGTGLGLRGRVQRAAQPCRPACLPAGCPPGGRLL